MLRLRRLTGQASLCRDERSECENPCKGVEASSLKARRSWNELLNRSLSEEEIADNLMTRWLVS
jgi:hypothetical protein